MKKNILWLILFANVFGVSAQSNTIDEYCARRAVILSSLDSTSALVMKSINENPYSIDYVQEPNFYYLTGIKQPSCIMLMNPNGISIGGKPKKVIIFSSKINEIENIQLCSTDTILNSTEFYSIFKKQLVGLKKLYYSAPDLKLVNDWLNDKPYFAEREMKSKMKASFPNLVLESAEYFVGQHRVVKSSLEVDYIKRASNITSDGLISAMKIAKAGMYEYELQAAIEYEFTRQGAMLRGFPSIIGSGLNNLILHYDANNRQTQNGDLVVMDVGAKYNGYSSDITRTIPVSGKFSDAQKEIYQMVLSVQKEAIALIKPGVQMQTIETFARNAFKKFGYDKYFIHGLSHPVGLEVHDINPEPILKTGMVITIEPGLYFPPDDPNIPEKYRGFGVRIEDTILVTGTGYEVLTAKAPKEVYEIEKIMKGKN